MVRKQCNISDHKREAQLSSLHRYKKFQSTSRQSKGEQGIWQRRFWEHPIRNGVDFIKHVEYIHFNPVKHGLVKSPIDRPYSSFRRYVKQGTYDRIGEQVLK